MLENVVLLALTAGLLVYLVVALLRPENSNDDEWMAADQCIFCVGTARGKAYGRVHGAACMNAGAHGWMWCWRPASGCLYKLTGVDAEHEMGWKEYGGAMLLFSAATALLTYGIERLQHAIPLLEPAAPRGSRAVSRVEHGSLVHDQYQLGRPTFLSRR